VDPGPGRRPRPEDFGSCLARGHLGVVVRTFASEQRPRQAEEFGMTPRQAGIALPTLPTDLPDLQLAPLVLTIDRRLNELDLLDLRELRLRAGLQAPPPDRSRASRRQALLTMVRHQLDSRGWTMSWNDRGIRILHDHHHVTLGVAKTFVSYIEGTDSVDAP